MLPTVTALAMVGGRHNSRSASCHAKPAGGSNERSLRPNECTVTRLPRGVVPSAPRSTVTASEAGADGAVVGDGVDGFGDATSVTAASAEAGAALAGVDGPPRAPANRPTAIAMPRVPLTDRRVPRPQYAVGQRRGRAAPRTAVEVPGAVEGRQGTVGSRSPAEYSPLITNNEPRIVPASLDRCLANLNVFADNPHGTSSTRRVTRRRAGNGRRRRPKALCQVLDDVLRIAAGAGHEHRCEGVLEGDAEEVHAVHRRADATLLDRPAVLADDVCGNEAVVGPVSGGPDHVGHVEDGAVGEHRPPVVHPDGLLVVAFDTGPVEVLQPDAQDSPRPIRTSGRNLRPTGVRIVAMCLKKSSTTGQPTMARFVSVTRIGIWPCDRPERIVRWSAFAASNAMSAPECESPTTRRGPSRSCVGLRYSCECSCRIAGSSSAARWPNGGATRRPRMPSCRARRRARRLRGRTALRGHPRRPSGNRCGAARSPRWVHEQGIEPTIVGRYVRLALVEPMTPSLAAQVGSLETALGLTPQAMVRLRLRVEDDRSRPVAAPDNIEAARRRYEAAR